MTRSVEQHSAADTPALEVSSLCAGYGGINVLQSVSLELGRGASMAVLGVNGSGKSTLANTLGGAVKATRGEITVYGQSIVHMSAAQRARIGIGLIPEGRGILPSLSVIDNLKSSVVGLRMTRAQTRATTEEALGRFPVLKRRLRQRAGSLSGGEQQMLATSRALARNPKVLVADEISLGLAPRIVDEVMEVLASVNAAGTSLLVIEQMVGRALAMTGSTLVLRRGSVVWAGKSADAHSRVVGEYLGEGSLGEV